MFPVFWSLPPGLPSEQAAKGPASLESNQAKDDLTQKTYRSSACELGWCTVSLFCLSEKPQFILGL